MLTIFLVIAGIYILTRDQFHITRNRIVSGDTSKFIGVILLGSVVLDLLIPFAGLIGLVLAIIVGIVQSEDVNVAKGHSPRKSHYVYQSPFKISRVVIGLLVVVMLIDVVAVWSGTQQTNLIQRLEDNDQSVTYQELEDNDNRQNSIGLLQSGAILITGIAFMSWMTRCYENIIAFRAAGLKYSPRWAWGGWIVPFLNFVRPLQVIKEIWKASDPATDVSQDAEWQHTPIPSLITAWWLIWIGGSLLGYYLNLSFNSAQTIEQFVDASRLSTFLVIVNISAGMLAISVVKNLTQRQEAKYSTLLSQDYLADDIARY